ncbi:MAG: sigma-70 family RNA polymerase sigma factor [Archangium sp.]|nr:sigma-70 family RNA polymerase sigma factor [Archangium sp.]
MHTFIGWVSDLARAHTKPLAAVARTEGLTGDDAVDAVQSAFETFLGLPVARELVGNPDDSRALMSVLVRNSARNMRRRAHSKQPHVDIAQEAQLADELPRADDLLTEAEQHILVMGCVNRLGKVQQHVVRLRMFEELSSAETAATLELKPNHVNVLLHRSKQDLVRCIRAQ